MSSEPALLLVEPAGTPVRIDRVVLGLLTVRCDRDLPAGSAIRIVQGYDENGRWLGGADLRYALPPLQQVGGRAYGVGARRVDRATGAVLGGVTVVALPPETGWLEARLEEPLPASAALEIVLGDATRPGLGPPSNPIPLELELAAELRLPAAPGSALPLRGRVPVRIAPRDADWLRVIVPAQTSPGAAVRATVVFMNAFSGPVQSSLDALVPAGTLEVTGPFATFTVDVNAEGSPAAKVPAATLPQSVAFELPPLPAGTHRIAVRFTGARELRGLSNPIVAGASDAPPLWFGSLHNHTVIGGHATSTPSRALRYARDVTALDFVALSEHREAPHFDGAWLKTLAERESRDGRFVVFTAWEWTDARWGHRHVVARTPCEPPPAPPDLKSFAATVGRDPDLLVIVHHPIWNGGAAQKNYDWGEPGALPRQLLAEAYSWHGCSLAHESAFPMHANHDQEFPPHMQTDILSALVRGHRVALVADGDGHFGKPGSLVGIEWPKGRRYAFQGLIGVHAPALDRDALFRALEQGDVYGTTGARLHLRTERRDHVARVTISASAPLAFVRLRSPTARLDEETFPAIPPDLGSADAPLYLDPAKGTWDVTLELTAAGDECLGEPWIVEVAQYDLHHAWKLLPPPGPGR